MTSTRPDNLLDMLNINRGYFMPQQIIRRARLQPAVP
jgi:hypothetical protein